MKDKKTYSLRKLRLDAGLTLQQLSEKTGIGASTIQVFETSKKRRENYDVVMKHQLADFFHVPVRLLFPEINQQAARLLGVRKIQIQEFIFSEEAKKD
jgi:transcriptional regulator with XRE-family HTH domain